MKRCGHPQWLSSQVAKGIERETKSQNKGSLMEMTEVDM